MQKMPTTKPPNAVPKYCRAMKGTGPSFIRQHIGFLVYLWTVYGNGFWMYPTGISNGILYGYVWKDSYYKYLSLRVSVIDSLY